MFATIRKEGFVRARVDGEVVDVEQVRPSWPRGRITRSKRWSIGS